MDYETVRGIVDVLEEVSTRELGPDDCKMYHGTGGIIIHPGELGPLFNLLQDNPRDWNRRLRRVVAAWMLHLMAEGKLDGNLEYFG
jgi:hypothetical protein